MTQGDPLSTMIFNVVVEKVLRHWVTVVAAMENTEKPFTEGFGRYIQQLRYIFMLTTDFLCQCKQPV